MTPDVVFLAVIVCIISCDEERFVSSERPSHCKVGEIDNHEDNTDDDDTVHSCHAAEDMICRSRRRRTIASQLSIVNEEEVENLFG